MILRKNKHLYLYRIFPFFLLLNIFTKALSQINKVYYTSSAEIKFRVRSVKLPKQGVLLLDSIFRVMQTDTSYQLTVTECGVEYIVSTSKRYGSLPWERANAVINYLIKKGISKDRFIFAFESEKSIDYNTIRLGKSENTN